MASKAREVPVRRCHQDPDPHLHYQVRWRQNGRQTSTTFEDQTTAELYRTVLEASGIDAADAWYEQLNQPGSQLEAPEPWTLDRWMAHYIRHRTGVLDGTRILYENEYRRAWRDLTVAAGVRLGALPLDAIDHDVMARAVNFLATQKRPATGRPLAPKTLRNLHGLLYAAFDAAVANPRIPMETNPCVGIRLPKGEDAEDDPNEMTCLSPSDFAALLQQIPAYWKPFVTVAYGTGLRWSEITALQIRDVNLTGATIRVTRAWKFNTSTSKALGAPKSNSRRTVKVSDELVDLLRPLIAERAENEFVFHTQAREGTYAVVYNTWRTAVWLPAVWRAQRCNKHMAKKNPCGCQYKVPRRCTVKAHASRANPTGCGCPGTLQKTPTFHDLRHSHASWLLAQNISPGIISKRLGHSSIAITMDTYSHLLDGSQDAAAAAMSLALT